MRTRISVPATNTTMAVSSSRAGAKKSGAKEDAKHRGVDRVPEAAVGAGAHQLVIRAEGRVKPQMPSKSSHAGPGQY